MIFVAGLSVKYESLRPLITALIGRRKMVCSVSEYSDPNAIGNVPAENTKEQSLKE
jgi:hypothetical protein